jgi:hypothetical protein
MMFSDLAERYKDFKVKPAEYRNDKKISGLRSYDKVGFRVFPTVIWSSECERDERRSTKSG